MGEYAARSTPSQIRPQRRCQRRCLLRRKCQTFLGKIGGRTSDASRSGVQGRSQSVSWEASCSLKKGIKEMMRASRTAALLRRFVSLPKVPLSVLVCLASQTGATQTDANRCHPKVLDLAGTEARQGRPAYWRCSVLRKAPRTGAPEGSGDTTEVTWPMSGAGRQPRRNPSRAPSRVSAKTSAARSQQQLDLPCSQKLSRPPARGVELAAARRRPLPSDREGGLRARGLGRGVAPSATPPVQAGSWGCEATPAPLSFARRRPGTAGTAQLCPGKADS